MDSEGEMKKSTEIYNLEIIIIFAHFFLIL